MHHREYSYYSPHCLAILLTVILMLVTTNVRSATYNAITGELFLPSLTNGSKTLIDVVIKLNPDGTFVISSNSESALSFQCPDVFSEATLDLIKSTTSVNEVDNILGCRSVSQTTTKIASGSGISSTWLDSQCSHLLATITNIPDIPPIISFSLTQNIAGCKPSIGGFAELYDLSTQVFLINLVLINNNVVASEVVIKFTDNKHYELINFALTPRTTPPVICRTITDVDFNAITLDMTPEKINQLLGCQWQQTNISNFGGQALINYFWSDHECNSIGINSSQDSINYSQSKSAGCGSF